MPFAVLSRDSVLDAVADHFAREGIDAIHRAALPFGELRWTGWKTSYSTTGLVGQLLLWVVDPGSEVSTRRYYSVCLPGGKAVRYESGDTFEPTGFLYPEDFALLRDVRAEWLASELRRALRELVDLALQDSAELMAALMWRKTPNTLGGEDEVRPAGDPR